MIPRSTLFSEADQNNMKNNVQNKDICLQTSTTTGKLDGIDPASTYERCYALCAAMIWAV